MLVYIPPHITNLPSSHSVGGFGYILPVEHCDYKVPTKSCMSGLLGGSALVLENPVSQIHLRHFLPIWKHCAKPCLILWIRIVLAFLKSHNIIFNNLPNWYDPSLYFFFRKQQMVWERTGNLNSGNWLTQVEVTKYDIIWVIRLVIILLTALSSAYHCYSFSDA